MRPNLDLSYFIEVMRNSMETAAKIGELAKCPFCKSDLKKNSRGMYTWYRCTGCNYSCGGSNHYDGE